MHEYGGFFANLPYAYMSRQFPCEFDSPRRRQRSSGTGSLLAMHTVTARRCVEKPFEGLRGCSTSPGAGPKSRAKTSRSLGTASTIPRTSTGGS